MQSQAAYHDLSIVIPAYCEEDGIAIVLDQLETAFPGAEIIVVDDASTDRTAEKALAHPRIIVMQHPFNQGYGAALSTGMRVATREYVAWFDADGEHRVEDLIAMLALIRESRLVAVLAQRRNKAVSKTRSVGKFAIRLFARLFDVNGGTDLNCGLRIFRRDVILNYLPLLPARYSASLTTTILLIERGYPTAFHTMETAPRIGHSKVKLRDGFAAVAKILNLIMLFAPMRIFFRGGALLVLVGMVYGLLVTFLQGLGFPVAGSLMVVVGILSIMLGLIADQISQIRLGSFSSHRPAFRLSSREPAVPRVGVDPDLAA